MTSKNGLLTKHMNVIYRINRYIDYLPGLGKIILIMTWNHRPITSSERKLMEQDLPPTMQGLHIEGT